MIFILLKLINKCREIGLTKVAYKIYKKAMYQFYIGRLHQQIEVKEVLPITFDKLPSFSDDMLDSHCLTKLNIFVLGQGDKATEQCLFSIANHSKGMEYEILQISTQYGSMCNELNKSIHEIDGDTILIIPDRCSIINFNWLSEMNYAINNVASDGIVIAASDAHLGTAFDTTVPICLMVKRSLIIELNGLNELLHSYDALLDFCLRAQTKGRKVVITNKQLVSIQNVITKRTNEMDRALMIDRWGDRFS